MTIKLSDWAGVKSIRSLSYTSGILQASQLDTLLAADIPHNLNALPDSLELWVEQGGGQWEQHDPSAYVLADDTNLVNTGTTLASVLGATTLVRLTASSGPVAISVGLADSGQAGLIAGLGNQTLSPALSLENTLSILPTTNQLVLGTTDTTTISATAPASSAVYTIPDVGTTADFVMTAGAQDIGGAKTFLASPTFPATVNYVSVGSITKGGAGALTLTAAGVSSITVPTVTGTMITSADTGTVTNTMLAGSIADSKLSTITTAGKVSNSATTATASNNANTIVARNAVGDFAAGTISASLNGNATTASSATVLATARNIWGQSFNGSANISGAITGATTIQMGTQANKATLTYTTNTTRTYTIPDAGANADFVMTAGNQTIAGTKTFSNGIKIASGVKTLNYFDSGTYIPAFSFGTFTYGSLRKAYWTRIGSLVLVQGIIQWTNRTASSDVVRITLPFTSANDAQFRSSVTIGFSSGVNLGTAQENITGSIARNEAFWTMLIYNQFTSSMGVYLVSYLLTAGEIQFSVAYHMNI